VAPCFGIHAGDRCHVDVVDPGVARTPNILDVYAGGHYLRRPTTDCGPIAAARAMHDRELGTRSWRASECHSRAQPSTAGDIFAPVAAELAAGRCQLRSLGKR